jgi:flagellar hook-basal body complex protein FliE
MSPISPVDISSYIRNPEMLTGANGASAAEALVPASTAGSAKPASFSSMLEGAFNDINSTMQAADTAKTSLLTGDTGNVHQAMIAVQESNVAFSLMVEVRNKLVDSYQELMRMQV